MYGEQLMKKRNWCLTAYLVLMILACVLGAATYFFMRELVVQNNPEIPRTLHPVFGMFNLLMAGCMVALWKWQKWGFWVFAIIAIAGGILNTVLSGSLLPVFVAPISILILYGVLNIGRESRAWKQLE